MTGILLLSFRSVSQKYRIHDLEEDTTVLKKESDSLTDRMNRIKSDLLHQASIDSSGVFAARLRLLFGHRWYRKPPYPSPTIGRRRKSGESAKNGLLTNSVSIFDSDLSSVSTSTLRSWLRSGDEEAASSSEPIICIVCLGVLQFVFSDGNRRCSNRITPHGEAARLYLKGNYNNEAWLQSENVSIKDVLKVLFLDPLRASLGVISDSSSFHIRLTLRHLTRLKVCLKQRMKERRGKLTKIMDQTVCPRIRLKRIRLSSAHCCTAVQGRKPILCLHTVSWLYRTMFTRAFLDLCFCR
ncbi:Uncharacterized protein Rs2_29299 [Raphanus sativus]|nr:Uncharacterized protein Rs2_29299 [Raphanus sativus]